MQAKNKSTEQQNLLNQLGCLAQGLARSFAPFCEVVVHDLTDPTHAIIAIENNLSGRKVGDPTTELGLMRIADSAYPQVLANYSNKFSDGRAAKSTSIGIKDIDGNYVAAVCLNIDLTVFQGVNSVISQFTQVDNSTLAPESLDPRNADAIRVRIDSYAGALATTARALRAPDRRRLVLELKASGAMDLRKSADIVADHLGVSRATVYNDGK